jgi:hypothetical protein
LALLAEEVWSKNWASKHRGRSKTQQFNKTVPQATQQEIKRQFRTDEKWNVLKEDQMTKQKNLRIVEKAAKAFEMKSNNMANINRRQIAKVNRNMANFDD